jgi:hypothetical protein
VALTLGGCFIYGSALPDPKTGTPILCTPETNVHVLNDVFPIRFAAAEAAAVAAEAGISSAAALKLVGWVFQSLFVYFLVVNSGGSMAERETGTALALVLLALFLFLSSFLLFRGGPLRQRRRRKVTIGRKKSALVARRPIKVALVLLYGERIIIIDMERLRVSFPCPKRYTLLLVVLL